MNTSRFSQIFSLAVVGGAIGMAIADTLSQGLRGGLGFVAGFLLSFGFLTSLAVISASIRSQRSTEPPVQASESSNTVSVVFPTSQNSRRNDSNNKASSV